MSRTCSNSPLRVSDPWSHTESGWLPLLKTLYAYTVGNPEIRILSDRAPDLSKDPPITHAEMVGAPVVWSVFPLRDRGLKLPKSDVMARRKSGHLFLRENSSDSRLTAWLQDAQGTTLEALDGVRLKRLERGGLLLHGHCLNTIRGEVVEVPQAWWCVINIEASHWAGN